MAVIKMYNSLSMLLIVACFTNTDSKMDPRIIDGVPATIDQFPHSVLMYVKGGKNSWTCGASILNQAVLLTVAHCVAPVDMKTEQIVVFAGQEIYTQSKVRREVKTFVTYSGYREKFVPHDIAILILKQPLPLGKKIKRVIIKPHFPNVNHAMLAGWGSISANDTTTLLQSASQKILSKETCAIYMDMSPGLFCAGDPTGVLGRGAHGDSGSALMAQFQQIGIVSFKTEVDGITFYTNVSYYYTWIKIISEEKYCK